MKSVRGWIALTVLLASAAPRAALAQDVSASTPSPSPVPSPAATSSPSPSPAPSYGIHYTGDGFVSFVSEAFAGPGLSPPEGPGFAAGAPLSPMTPYDVFYSSPETPGNGGVAQFAIRASYSSRSIDASASLGLAGVTGSVQTNAYWTENLLEPLNPHLGSQALPYSIVFATNAGQDDGSAARLSLLSASVGTHDGALNLRGGWFDLVQNDRFVFVQPTLTNVTPAIGMQTAESLGNGPLALDSWPTAPPGLPLDGADLVAHRGVATVEITNAALPALPGTSARLTLGSIVLDHGEGTRWSADLLHLSTGGDFLNTTTMFGVNAMTVPGPQGPLPTSTLGGQQQTVAGLRGAFHATRWLDATVEVGRSWFDAQDVLEPGTQAPGGFYHVGVTHPFGRAAVAADFYRWEPRYATAILPYGIPENVWSVAWSWPGVWLKSNYQLADDTTVGTNRQGFRVRYTLDKGPIEVHAAYAQFQQIDQAVLSNVNQVGFVDGFFLPQFDDSGTLGTQHQYALWAAWHPAFGDVVLDYINDTQHRDFVPLHPEDAVSYQAPQIVFTYSRPFGKRAIADIGYAKYAMRGSWAFGPLTNVDYQQSAIFAGAQYAESPHATFLAALRHANFTGLPSEPAGPSPDFNGTVLVVEQRYHI
jgi:hypothetical protein